MQKGRLIKRSVRIFCCSEAKKSAEEFLKYDMVNNPVDKFFGRWPFWNGKYTSLRKVMIFALTLHYGQVQIERGFNINASLLVENLTASSSVQQRRVYNHLSVTKSSSHGFEINDERCVTCLNASPKYKENPKEIKNAGEEKQKWRRKTQCSSEQWE